MIHQIGNSTRREMLRRAGADRDTILRKHPQLTADDVEQATSYASSAIQNEVLLTTEVGALGLGELQAAC